MKLKLQFKALLKIIGKVMLIKSMDTINMVEAAVISETRAEHNQQVVSQIDQMIEDLEATIESMMQIQNPSI